MSRGAGTARHALQGQCLAPGRPAAPREGAGRYGRLFPRLPALEVEANLLHALGTRGKACDGSADERQAGVAAGWPFFGQFVAHDITADRSPLDHTSDAKPENARSPRLNLECLYGGGPVGSPYLYDRTDTAKLLLSPGGIDLPRNAQDVALVGDPRNDVHLFVNQLHVALARAHNAVVDGLRAEGAKEAGVFADALRTMVWHYQWVVLHDFLGGLLDDKTYAGLADRTLPRLADGTSIPVEFADAAYRYGHSQIRPGYQVNERSGVLSMFPDLLGFRKVGGGRAVDWSLFFAMPGRPAPQRCRRIDARVPLALIELPEAVTGEVDDPSYRSLASRDLQRGRATGLPSGEAVARALGVEPLPKAAIALPDWPGETPLWFYIGREADHTADGERLGPVGSRIVGEVLFAIVDTDPDSHRAAGPGWRPTLPAATGRPTDFALIDLLLLEERLRA